MMPRASTRTARSTKNPTEMMIKRSVSPDGRIDSLSVSITTQVENIPAEVVRATAKDALALQREITELFLGANGSPADDPTETEEDEMPAAPARLVAVGGMDGKWGRRLFLTIESDGQRLRLFGTERQLAAQLHAAGYPSAADNVAEGYELDLPCRIVTKPSPDGRFVNVERLLPPERRQAALRRRR